MPTSGATLPVAPMLPLAIIGGHAIAVAGSAGNKVVEFSFKEIFDLVELDEINRKILVLLEVMNKPLLVRQISDILGKEEETVDTSVRQLLAFQCLTKVPAEVDDKYTINPDLRLLATSLVQRFGPLAIEMKNAIARLPAEKQIDFSSEELEISVLFQEYLTKGEFVAAEDFVRDKLRDRPNSILLNLHYARFLGEHKRAAADAIARLERVREASSNHPHVLRLLMNYNVRLDVPNFEQASLYAKRLQEGGLWDDEVKLDAAEFNIQWGTSIKLKFDLDPIKEMLRQQRYKELADESVAIMKTCEGQESHRWNYLMAQCHFLKWEYDLAKRRLDRAISILPSESYLKDSYERFGSEIMKKWTFYKNRRQ
jgi:tetratricopeptide (TPR) repeat protein